MKVEVVLKHINKPSVIVFRVNIIQKGYFFVSSSTNFYQEVQNKVKSLNIPYVLHF